MVSQAQVTTNGNGRRESSELPPRAVARNAAEFLHDVATLAELQGKLAVVDLQEGVAKLLTPVVLIAGGAAVLLGCIPIALFTLAVAIDHFTELSPPAAFGIALVTGLVIGAILVFVSLGALKRGVKMFDRSLEEWRRNRQWAKETLKRLGQSTPRSPLPTPGTSRF